MDDEGSNEKAARGGRDVVFAEDDDLSRVTKVTNEVVLRRAQSERELMKQIVKRQCSFLGQIVRKGGIKCQVVARKVEGRKER